MAKGIPVMIPEWIDTSAIPEAKVVKFAHKRGMRNTLYDYITNDKKRKEYSDRLEKAVNEHDSIYLRIDSVFSQY